MADWKIWTTNWSKRKVVNVKTLTGKEEMEELARDLGVKFTEPAQKVPKKKPAHHQSDSR